jgi:hypothetical protein
MAFSPEEVINERLFLKQFKVTEKMTLCASLAIGAVLFVAAWGKFFHPAELTQTLDRWESIFEILFLLAMIYFRRHWQMWLMAAVIFLTWGGYALYWYQRGLPCGCMGAKLHIPTLYAIVLDLLFFAVSLALAYLLKRRSTWALLGVLFSAIGALMGYFVAGRVYEAVIG